MTFNLNLSYDSFMKFRGTSRIFGTQGTQDHQVTQPAETLQSELISPLAVVDAHSSEEEDSTVLKTVGWISAGLGAVALGLFVGRELRLRYKFNRRTPYDFYAHSGDEQDVDFGLGI